MFGGKHSTTRNVNQGHSDAGQSFAQLGHLLAVEGIMEKLLVSYRITGVQAHCTTVNVSPRSTEQDRHIEHSCQSFG